MTSLIKQLLQIIDNQ